MIPDNINILVAIIAMIFLSHSWYIHYKVKDGLARKMLLWGCGILLLMFFNRIIIYLFFEGAIQKTLNQYNFLLLYIIILGQQYFQRGHAERNEDKKAQADKKELNKLRR